MPIQRRAMMNAHGKCDAAVVERFFSGSLSVARAVLFAACGTAALTGQSAAPTTPTPAATTSGDCPVTAVDTHRFLAASAVPVRAPRGPLELVPVTTAAARERGLMCVVRIPPDRGMLFVFTPPDRMQGFWMKNTLVALDMVFVRSEGTVSDVAADIPPTPDGTPDDAVARRAGVGQFVIELAAGQAARHGIVPGTKLALPALSPQE
jgi:uncharacterized membrane protein (UPF0127 family)